MLICGIDEAGRGPVIGPMVVCGVVIEEREEFELEAFGVKDSKELLPTTRDKLFNIIKDTAPRYKIIIVPSEEIDKAVDSDETNLNWLEVEKTAKIINYLKPDKVLVDCPSNNLKAYKNKIISLLDNKDTKIVVAHKADKRYPIVAAASILAKVIRDREITKLKRRYNVEFGSGYPSDEFTKRFLEKNYNKFNFFRKSWASYKEVAKKKGQRILKEF
jgi:ribonuclease HII